MFPEKNVATAAIGCKLSKLLHVRLVGCNSKSKSNLEEKSLKDVFNSLPLSKSKSVKVMHNSWMAQCGKRVCVREMSAA